MNARAPIALLALLLGFNLSARQHGFAQEPTPAQEPPLPATSVKPPESGKPQDMEKWLNIGEAHATAERLMSLGVDRKVAEDFTSESPKQIQFKPIRTGLTQGSAILFLPCVLDDAYLYLFALKANTWQIAGWERFDCHYDMSVSVEVAPIRNLALDEILVHHAGEGHGASYSQQDFEVFDIANGKLKRVLDAEGVILAMQYVGPNTPMNEIKQESLFVLVPINNSRSCVVEETQSYQINNKLTVRRRQFRWNAAKVRYVPSKFIPVVATSN